jgi:hypothetical protein
MTCGVGVSEVCLRSFENNKTYQYIPLTLDPWSYSSRGISDIPPTFYTNILPNLADEDEEYCNVTYDKPIAFDRNLSEIWLASMWFYKTNFV